MLTPSSPGWNIVVYPSSAILFTLRRDCLSPGNISPSLAASNNCSNGSLALCDVLSFELAGRITSLLDTPSASKSRSLLMKWDVAPESMIMLCCLLLASCLIHLFDLGIVVAFVESNMFIFSSCSLFSSLSSFSGVQCLLQPGCMILIYFNFDHT